MAGELLLRLLTSTEIPSLGKGTPTNTTTREGTKIWPPDCNTEIFEKIFIDDWCHRCTLRSHRWGKGWDQPKSWLTDQVYTGGVGYEFSGIGPVINLKNRDAKSVDQCGNKCAKLVKLPVLAALIPSRKTPGSQDFAKSCPIPD